MKTILNASNPALLTECIDAMPGHLAILDAAGTIILVNDAWNRCALGNSFPAMNTFPGQNYLDVLSANAEPSAKKTLEGFESLLCGEIKEFQIECPCRSANDERWFRLLANPLTQGGIIVIYVDITDRVKSEQKAAANERRMAEAQQIAHVGTWSCDMSNDAMILSDEMQRICEVEKGWRENTYQGFLERILPEDRNEVRRVVAEALRERRGFEHRYRLTTPSGTKVLHEWGSVEVDEQGTPILLLATTQDVTRQHWMEMALKNSEQRIQNLVDSNFFGVILWNAKGEISYCNDALLNIIGYTREEFTQRNIGWRDLTPAEFLQQDEMVLRQLADHGSCPPYKKEYIHSDGRRIPILLGAAIFDNDRTSGVAFVLDMSEQCKLEEKLGKAQKMEAIGRLAGGVAHEFNNLLTVIIGRAAMVMKGLKEDEYPRAEVLQIKNTSEKAAKLVKQMLQFSAKQVARPAELNASQVLGDMTVMLGGLMGENIAVDLQFETSANVHIDATQFQQMILNLSINARDAMPSGGALSITVSELKVGFLERTQYPDLEFGDYVAIEVRDSGCGMDEAKRKRIFEPFYSTKSMGTGLGLSTVYGIVKQNRGDVYVESEVAVGSAFTILLPKVAQGIPAPASASELIPVKLGDTILLVEDQQDILDLFVETLRDAGYRVLHALNGEEALELSKATKEPIDLLLTDVVMPGMNGRELAERMKVFRPAIKVVFMSGYTRDIVSSQHAELNDVVLLEKPIEPEALLRSIRKVLKQQIPTGQNVHDR